MFEEIERRRRTLKLTQSALCKRAKVHPTNYSGRKAGRQGMSERTLKKLTEALDAIEAEETKAAEARAA